MKKLIALSLLNLAVSGVTLTIVVVGAKKAADEIEVIRTKTNGALRNVKRALEDLGEI
jgi:hypothetical protein